MDVRPQFAPGSDPHATEFATAVRATPEELERAIAAMSSNPVIDATLRIFAGILAVLNPQRQIVSLNTLLLQLVGVDDPGQVLGLRLGEAIDCVHALEGPGGCGTSRFCRTCGAAIAMVVCQESGEPVERECVATVRREGRPVDYCLTVRATPLDLEGERFTVLFLQDVTRERRRDGLDSFFFHDLNNLATGLHGAAALLAEESHGDIAEISRRVESLTSRLCREVLIQRALRAGGEGEYPLQRTRVRVASLLEEVRDAMSSHPAAQDRSLELYAADPEQRLSTDPVLVLRILCNMATNAFEAIDAGGTVRLSARVFGQHLIFAVWNEGVIHEDTALRVFQQFYSTKAGRGRGLGTYAMKLFGETFLGGRVEFSSTPDDGTEFRLILPLESTV